jgi:hypothetical protein
MHQAKTARVDRSCPTVKGTVGLCTVVLAMSAGCGRQAIATTDALPVARVVVYRNGVAYFERAGYVDGSEVRFKMKRGELGDFLATLAVMERGGSSVRAAAFPLKADDDVGAKPPTNEPSQDDMAGLETVILSLDGRAHQLQVGYVAESPVWRPSYRLVVHPAGEADLQVWGIVQNLSGEDWKNVKLSLVAGAPLAFQAELGTPVIPLRPTVTDEGEVIAAVPRAETSLRQEPPAPDAPPPAPIVAADVEPSAADEASGTGGGPRRSADKKTQSSRSPAGAAMAPASSAPRSPRSFSESIAPSPAAQAVSVPRNLRSLAAIAVEGGSTRYDLPLPVTVPDKSATMVMLLSRSVSGEALFLFAPDGAVPDSSSHPFRVARFTNAAGGMLERGPIAVFDGGAFLGQGMVDPLPAGATATVPFALERGIAVDEDRRTDEQSARLAKIDSSELTIDRDRVTQTKYRVRNGGDLPAKTLLKHPRIAGARLFAPPAGTEDNVGTGSALVPLTVASHATAEIVVDERATERKSADWFSPIADTAVKVYLADPKADREVGQRLSAAWVIRANLVSKSTERDKLRQQVTTLSSATEETRRNLHAIDKNKTAEALRQKLTARLADGAARLDDLNRKIVELDAKLSELGVQFSEAIRDIKFVAADANGSL